MRIIAGSYKGRVLYEPKFEGVRPTLGRIRENLFNILYPLISGARFLDAFAGTGVMGIEAESRGATVTLAEISKDSLALIEKNLRVVNSKARLYRRGYEEAMRTGVYDVIYCDPPYHEDHVENILKLSDRALSEDGIVIFESDRELDTVNPNYEVYDRRHYGIAHLTFFRRKSI